MKSQSDQKLCESMIRHFECAEEVTLLSKLTVHHVWTYLNRKPRRKASYYPHYIPPVFASRVYSERSASTSTMLEEESERKQGNGWGCATRGWRRRELRVSSIACRTQLTAPLLCLSLSLHSGRAVDKGYWAGSKQAS